MNTDSFTTAKATVLEILANLAMTEPNCRAKNTDEMKLYNYCWAQVVKDSHDKIMRLPRIQSAAQLQTSLPMDREVFVATNNSVFTANVVDKTDIAQYEDVLFHIRNPDWPRLGPYLSGRISSLHPMLLSFFERAVYFLYDDIAARSGNHRTTLLQVTNKHIFFKHNTETGSGADTRTTEEFHHIESISSQPLDGYVVMHNGKLYYHGTREYGEFWTGIFDGFDNVLLTSILVTQIHQQL